MEDLYHYYDQSAGQFRNLSDLAPEETEHGLAGIRQEGKGFASKRSADYLDIRRSLEHKAREAFIEI